MAAEQQRWEEEATSIRLRLTRLEEDVAQLHGSLPSGSRLASAIRDVLATERSDAATDRDVLLRQVSQDRAQWQREAAGLQKRVAALEKSNEDHTQWQMDLAGLQMHISTLESREAASREADRTVEAIKCLIGREREQLGCSTPSVSTAATAEVGEGPELRLTGRVNALEVLLHERCSTLETRLRLLDEAMVGTGQAPPHTEGEHQLTAAEARLAMREESDWWRREVVRLEAETARGAARLDHLESRIEEAACRGEVQRLRAASEVATSADRRASAEPSSEVGLLSERVAQLDGELGALRALCREAATGTPVAGETLQREVAELCTICRAARADSQSALGAWKQEAQELRKLYSQVHQDGQALQQKVEAVSTVQCSLGPLKQQVEQLAARFSHAPAAPAAAAPSALEELRRAVEAERSEREDAQRLLSDGIEEKLQRILLKVDWTCKGLLQGLGCQQTSSASIPVARAAAPAAGDPQEVRAAAVGCATAAAAAGCATARSRVRVKALPCGPTASTASDPNAGSSPVAVTVEPMVTSRARSAPPRELGYPQQQVCSQPASLQVSAPPPLSEAITPRRQQLQRAASLQQLSASQRASASPTRHVHLGPSMGAHGARLREATRCQVAVPVDVVPGGQREWAFSLSAPASAAVPAEARERLLRENRELRERNAALLEENAVMRYATVPPQEAALQQQQQPPPQPWPGTSATAPAVVATPVPTAAMPASATPGAEEASASAFAAATIPVSTPDGPGVVAMPVGAGQRGESQAQGDRGANGIGKAFDAVHERLARRRSEMAAAQAQRQAQPPQPPA